MTHVIRESLPRTIVTQSWLRECCLDVRRYRNWWVDIEMGAELSTPLLYIAMDSEKWSLRLQRADRISILTFTSTGCHRERDDLEISDGVVEQTRPSQLIDFLSKQIGLRVYGHTVIVRSNVLDAPRALRAWFHSLHAGA